MNRRQKVVLIGAGVVFIVILVFPPCTNEGWLTPRRGGPSVKYVFLPQAPSRGQVYIIHFSLAEREPEV